MEGNGDIIICRCEEVNLSEIVDAIRGGAITVSGVNRRTRAGMGLCQGRTCKRIIARIISSETKQPIEKVIPPTSRPPVRPIALETLANEKVE